ncbi:SRPBCC family protein [uncultured Croceitalea sp.]|uniref:SRPBCC family protein n=1 Tax=uncultured Croceitalea sp. TaxID=1798908 RepID=UPI0033063C82
MKLTTYFAMAAILFMGCKKSEKNGDMEQDMDMNEPNTEVYSIEEDARLTQTLIIDARADRVWGLLRELDDVDKYSSTIAKVEFTGNKGVGGERLCTSVDGKGFFKEKIVAFDDRFRTYSYSLVEGVPVKGMVNTFKVVNLGYGKSALIWSSNFEQFMENPNMTEDEFMAFMDSASKETLQKIGEAATSTPM